MMRIYRCVIGCLFVLFIVISVWYVVSCYNEQQTIDKGTLIWRVEDDTNHSIC